MSLSKPRPTGNKNPADVFFQWKGGFDQGFFEYYDKERKVNVQVDFTDIDGFFILDKDLFSITGWDDDARMAIISNEVRDVNDILTINGWKEKKKKQLLQGPYTDLKEVVKASKVYKYTRCVYAMWQGQLAHIKLTGASFANFLTNIESSGTNMTECYVYVKEVADGLRGKVQYKYPVFAFGDKISVDDYNQALELDRKLQAHLDSYLTGGTGVAPEGHTADDESQDIDVKKWRGVITPHGDRLCEYTLDQIRDLLHVVVEEDPDGPMFQYITEALHEYDRAEKNWKTMKNKAGIPMSDIPYSEILDLVKTVPRINVNHIFLQVAELELRPKPEDKVKRSLDVDIEYDFSENDVPF